MSMVIMVQGTMSNAGKSILCAGLCRIFKEDGYRPAPFKSQNMALNSYITEDGLEMGRAQVVQAQACGEKPVVWMNPILLKPTSDEGSQVIVNGKVVGNMRAREYFQYKKTLIPDIVEAFHKLEEDHDIIVIEGAGSPAEINLRENDIVNMGLAELINAPVLLVGDIDPGGVFAQLYGTAALLTEEEQNRIKGLVINKFRGDKTLLDPGIEMLEEKMHIPVLGVVPYMKLALEDEDSLSLQITNGRSKKIDIAVIRLPHMSNQSDMTVFHAYEDVSVRYISETAEIRKADLIILPGSKNTIEDLRWLKQCGLAEAIMEYANAGGLVWGICGGYQMLGTLVSDPDHTECGGEETGLCLLPMNTVLKNRKTRKQIQETFSVTHGPWQKVNGLKLTGYEIHMGESFPAGQSGNPLKTEDPENIHLSASGNVYGSYMHGVFDAPGAAGCVLEVLAERKGIRWKNEEYRDMESFRESQFDLLAKTLRKHLNMDEIYRIMREYSKGSDIQ